MLVVEENALTACLFITEHALIHLEADRGLFLVAKCYQIIFYDGC